MSKAAQNRDAFLVEFAALLAKYRATIEPEVDRYGDSRVQLFVPPQNPGDAENYARDCYAVLQDGACEIDACTVQLLLADDA